jgi:hypothetical protein
MSELLAEAFRNCYDSSAAAGVPGDVDEATPLDDIERELIKQHGAQLPVRAKANEVWLIENTSGRWEVRQAFELSKR